MDVIQFQPHPQKPNPFSLFKDMTPLSPTFYPLHVHGWWVWEKVIWDFTVESLVVGAGSPFSRHASWTLYHFLSHFPTSSTSLSLSPSSKPSHLDFSQLPPPNYLLQFTYLWLQYLLPPQQWNIYNFSVWFSIMKIEINWTKLHIILLLFFYIKKHYYLNLSHDFFFLFVHVRLIRR